MLQHSRIARSYLDARCGPPHDGARPGGAHVGSRAHRAKEEICLNIAVDLEYEYPVLKVELTQVLIFLT